MPCQSETKVKSRLSKSKVFQLFIGRLTFHLFLIITGLNVQAQLLNFTNYSLEQGLPATGVFDFAMGPDGKIWMATDGGGIAAFNGETFQIYNETNGFDVSVVRSICADSSQRVWAASSENELYMFQSEWHLAFGRDAFEGVEIRALSPGPADMIFVGTTRGVAMVGDSLSWPSWNNQLPHADVHDLLFLHDTLWIATDVGLVWVHHNQVSVISGDAELPSDKIVALAPARKGGVWAGTSQGLAHCRNGECRAFKNNTALPVKRIRSICESVDGTVWLGTYSGAIRLQPDNDFRPEWITNSNGLADNRLRSIFQEPSGSIWFATYLGGVSQLANTTFEHLTPNPTQKFAFSAIAESAHNSCLAGVFENGLVEISDNRMQWIDRSDYSVRSISAPYGDVQWFVHNDGLSYVKNRKVFRYNLPDTVSTAFFYHCQVVGDELFVTSHNQILVRPADPNAVAPLRVVAGFEVPEIILDFEITSDSTIWAITDNQLGLWRFKWEDSLFLLIEHEELQGSQFTDIAADRFGQIWVASLNRGLFRLSEGRVNRLHRGNGLNSNRIHQLLFDDMENLWVGGLHGIEQIVLTEGNELIEKINQFTYMDGLRSMHTNLRAAHRDSHNQLWFGTMDGVTNYNARRKVEVSVPPEININWVDLFFDPATDWGQFATSINPFSRLPENLELPHNKNHLTFHFHGINLAKPASVVYQYKLDGVEGWSPITANRQVTYPNIPPGNYTFMVMSRGDNGVWNADPALFSFTIRQPFYFTFWFIAGCLLIITLIVWLFVRSRVNRFKQERIYLEKEVEMRTADLLKEKEKSDELLLNILPAKTAEELKEKGSADARMHSEVSVLFTDFQGFTQMAEKLSTTELVATLDECFKAFDSIAERYNAEKIKTIGDAYMCATGLPDRDPDHAVNAVRVGIEMHRFMNQFNTERRKAGKPEWPLRVGIHSGAVVSGIVGRKKFVYDIWGDTVNMASRVESASEAGRINISATTKELLADQFEVEPRGKISVKNKGDVEMYFVKP